MLLEPTIAQIVNIVGIGTGLIVKTDWVARTVVVDIVDYSDGLAQEYVATERLEHNRSIRRLARGFEERGDLEGNELIREWLLERDQVSVAITDIEDYQSLEFTTLHTQGVDLFSGVEDSIELDTKESIAAELDKEFDVWEQEYIHVDENAFVD
jgi:hypothetical protein